MAPPAALALALLAVVACGKSSPTSSKDEPPPAMPRYPVCSPGVMAVAMPEAPLGKTSGHATIVHGRLVATDTKKHPMQLATLDLATKRWDPLPSVDLAGEHDVLPGVAASSEQVVVGFEKPDGYGIRVLDRWKRTWSEPTVPAGWTHGVWHAIYDALVVVPYRPCGFYDFAGAHRMVSGKLVAVPAPLAPRVHATEVIVGGFWIVFGGTGYANAPATGDVGCDNTAGGAPLADGAYYDSSTDRWTKLPAGPPARRSYRTVATPHVVYAWTDDDRVVWQYDLGSNTWRRFVELPAAFTEPHGDDSFHERTTGAVFGDRLVLLHLSARKGQELLIDRKSGAITERDAPPIDIANDIPVDDRWLVLPRGPSKSGKPLARPSLHVGYFHDTHAGTWCELPWGLDQPFAYTWLERDDGTIVAWSPDGAATGAFIDFR